MNVCMGVICYNQHFRADQKERTTNENYLLGNEESDGERRKLFSICFVYTHTFVVSDLSFFLHKRFWGILLRTYFLQRVSFSVSQTSTATAHKSNHATHSSPQPLHPPPQKQSNTHTPPSPSSSPSPYTSPTPKSPAR